MRQLAPTIIALFAASCGGNETSIMRTPNEGPQVVIWSPADGAVLAEGELITFTATVEDDTTPTAEITLAWTSSLDGTLEEGFLAEDEGLVNLVTADLSQGSHLVKLTAADSDNSVGSDEVTITIGEADELPTVTILHPTEDEHGVQDESFELQALVEDPQDLPEDLLVHISSDLDGDLCVDLVPDATGVASCEAVLSVAPDLLEGVSDAHQLLFEVEDLDANTAGASTSFEVWSDTSIDNDLDGLTEDEGDCDDTDPDVYPGAEESCNEVDDDCDGTVDEGTSCYDDDGDCYCEFPNPSGSCTGSANSACSSLDTGDCDDDDAAIHPSAAETCDGVDNDCSGVADEGTSCYDDDGDCYCESGSCAGSVEFSCGHVASGDCDDADASAYPGASESADGVDNDCDGTVDEGTSAYDDDGDHYTEDGGDCDDADPAVNPGATETCNGIDDDCDGATDEDDASDAPTWYADADGDGYGNASFDQTACSQPSGYVSDSSDCDDGDASTHPGAIETCDGDDDDCDGNTDDDDTTDASTSYSHPDGDGYGYSSTTSTACSAPSGHVSDSSDCDDADSAVHPGATEICDGVDNDCDGLSDDADSSVTGTSTWHPDGDGDGYGSSSASVDSCSAPSGYLADDSDCNDGMATIHPGATETCNGYDDDCDGLSDDDDSGVTGTSTFYADGDGDGYGDSSSSTSACSQPSGHVSNDEDCYDSNADANPAQAGYFTTDRGDGSYDYDCNGNNDQMYTSRGSCGGWPACTTYAGWVDSVQRCGYTDDYLTSCSTGWTSCTEYTSSTTQSCR